MTTEGRTPYNLSWKVKRQLKKNNCGPEEKDYDTAMRRWGRGGGEGDAPTRLPSPATPPFALVPGDNTLSEGG